MENKVFTKTSQKKINLELFSTENTNTIDCLIVLNCGIYDKWLEIGIKCATNIILADGGANKMFQSEHRDNDKIRAVVGDFDSIEEEVKEYYKQKLGEVFEMSDQDNNDFEKALIKGKELGFKTFICVGSIGNRIDHTLSSFHLLTKYARESVEMEIFLVGEGNFAYLIQPKIEHEIRISKHIEKDGCGLISFSKAEYVETEGFTWNMGKNFDFQSLEWGNFLSTSNSFAKESIKVTTSHEILFVGRVTKK